MVFSSLKFTLYFLPAVMLVYFLAKEEYRNGILLIASLVFMPAENRAGSRLNRTLKT